MTIQEMVKKYKISIVRAGVNKGKMAVAGAKKATQKEIAEIRNKKAEIMAYLEEKHIADMKAMEEKEEQERLEIERKRNLYMNGKEIEMVYEEGEYLSGHRIVCSIAGEMLAELGFAHYVAGWGYLAHSEIENIENLTLEKATAETKEEEKEEEKEISEEEMLEEKIEQAKALGHKVEVYRMTTDCDGSVGDECSTDIVVGYVDGTGKITSERIHTY